MKGNVRVQCGQCGRGLRFSLDLGAPRVAACAMCGAPSSLVSRFADAEGNLTNCASCGRTDLYTRKAFPKGLGIAVVAGAAAATVFLASRANVPPWAIYAPLFLAAAADAVLYWRTPDAVGCYRCRAVHRGVKAAFDLAPFDLERAEELRLGRKVGSRAS